MANMKIAIDFVLRQEDAQLTGKVTTLSGDNGGATRFGLASKAHPELVAQGYFDEAKTPRDKALVIAEGVYNTTYGVPLDIPSYTDEAVATAVLSLSVNAYTVQTAKILQASLCAIGKPVTVDGHVGPGTLAAINSSDPVKLLSTFCNKVQNFYTDLAVHNPNDAPFLKGWLNRVQLWLTSAVWLDKQAAAAA